MTPTFTSGKIKMMISSVLSVSKSMMEEISDISMKKSDMDIKEVTTKFTVNSMAICILGIEPGTERSDIFLSEAQKHFDTASFTDLLRLSVMNRFPDLSNKFGMKLLRKEVEVFFKNIISDCVRYREENNYTRPDFLELMMNLVNETKHTSNPFDNDRMNAEIFDFFLASLDTSSSTISYTLFELAKHPEIQERMRSEMNKILGRHNGKIDSNCLNEMKYLHQIIDETLRLYPPLPNLERKCVKDYKIDGTDLIIEKGTSIFIPVLGFHRDPEYYPDPEKFDPERFSDENKGNKSKIFLSFGSGPRSCIGLRFGYMLVRVALVKILMEYRVTVSESTKLPLEMDKHTLMLTLKNPILLKAEKI